MNGRDLTLGLVGALAVGAALGRRGSRATAPFVSQHGPYTITVMFQPAAPGKRNASGRAEATLNGSEIGEVVFEDYGRLYVQWSSVDKDHRRQGLASAMYDAIERATRLPLTSGDIASSLGALGLWIKRGKLTREQALERYGEWVSRDEEFSEGSEGYEEMMDTARRALRGSRATDPTSTPAFRRWFGESKVVDGAGRPLVVFHGTGATFDTFDKKMRGFVTESSDSKTGFFFTSSLQRAEDAAQDAAWMTKPEAWSRPAPDAARVMRVYLKMERPFVRYDMQDDPADTARIIRAAKRAGHDGLIWIQGERGGRDYVVFEPTQIKSATGNRGTFDPADPRISFNRGVR